MIRKIAGLETNNRYLLVSTLVLMLGAGGCNLLKNLLKKGDTGADASAAPSAIAAPSVIVPEVPTVVPVAPSVVLPATHVHVATSTSAKTSTHTGTSTAVATAAPTTVASVVPAASTTAPVIPVISAQCQQACQKAYQDCVGQSGTLSGVALIRKCRDVLAPCITGCK